MIEAFAAQHNNQLLDCSLAGLPSLNNMRYPETRSDDDYSIYDLSEGDLQFQRAPHTEISHAPS